MSRIKSRQNRFDISFRQVTKAGFAVKFQANIAVLVRQTHFGFRQLADGDYVGLFIHARSIVERLENVKG